MEVEESSITPRYVGEPMTTEQRFWSKVDRSGGADSCWVWLASIWNSGYGQFFPGGGKNVSAHRYSYELAFGPIPDGLVLDHLCGNKRCVNPFHLEAVTHRENTLRFDGVASKHAEKTHCPKGHPYSGDNLYEWRGSRFCRECRRERMKMWKLKKPNLLRKEIEQCR